VGAKQVQSGNLAPAQFFKTKLEGTAIYRHRSILILHIEAYTSVSWHSLRTFLFSFQNLFQWNLSF